MTRGVYAAVLLALTTTRAEGQRTTPARWEARGEGTVSPHVAMLLGAGVSRAASTYGRLAFVAAAGTAWRTGRARRVGRAGVQGRFILDPFRPSGVSLYGVGGGDILFDQDAAPRPVLTVALGIEGPPTAGVNWGFEGGLGGGVRLAAVLFRRPLDANR